MLNKERMMKIKLQNLHKCKACPVILFSKFIFARMIESNSISVLDSGLLAINKLTSLNEYIINCFRLLLLLLTA